MKALILNGSLPFRTDLIPLQDALIAQLHEADWATETVKLSDKVIKPCIGCFRCWYSTPGICTGVKPDDAMEIIKSIIKTDLLVFLTPLTFGGYSSEIKKIFGRMLGILQPGMTIINGEVHHLKRYNTFPSFLAIAMTPELDYDEVKLFKTLVDRNSKNFYPPKHFADVLSYSDENLNSKVQEILKEVIL
jgi:multimeric flavodoxin WrbA